MKKTKSIFFATLGCRLNQAETERLRAEATSKGFVLARDKKSADIFIFNSCSVTDKAQRDTNKILRQASERYSEKEIIITGCGAKREHEKYGKVILNKDKQNLFEALENSGKNNSEEQKYYSEKTRLMYKVQDGCNNFCSYCIVPYLRGREVSESPESVLEELKEAEKSGFQEVVLCGVNIGKWGNDRNVGDVGVAENEKRAGFKLMSSSGLTRGSTINIDSRLRGNDSLRLADLIHEILKKTNFPRIRLSSISPDDFTNDLVDLWVKNDRLCPHFHISLQSGSDGVLRRMGRRYNTEQYSDLVAKLRKKIPDVQITTDIIVGFPGETEAEYAETIAFVKKMRFLKVHVFRYSKREGTRAAKMQDQISDKNKKERATKLQRLDSEIRQEILKKYIGKEVEVLFEQEKKGHYSGFTTNYIRVFKKSKKELTNEIVKVKIMGVIKGSLLAE